jgi:SSS family solute:Na+ symporter
MLGFLALLGFVAIKAGTRPIDLNGAVNPQLVVPQLFLDHFPAWFAGVALAAIAIGALVPAAIMSIAAANMFTRNIYRDFLRPDVDPKTEAKVSKIVSHTSAVPLLPSRGPTSPCISPCQHSCSTCLSPPC